MIDPCIEYEKEGDYLVAYLWYAKCGEERGRIKLFKFKVDE
jgi:hypothetical protein